MTILEVLEATLPYAVMLIALALGTCVWVTHCQDIETGRKRWEY